MTDPASDELRLLRRRAYGPAADIHADPAALQRLHELEALRRAPAPSAEIDEQPLESPATEPVADSVMPVAPVLSQEPTPPPSRRAPFRPRRSTVLVALGAVALVIVAGVVLTVVQRVQTDPFGVGAEQVARLPEDAFHEVPQWFAGSASARPARGFAAFHDLRAVIPGYRGEWFGDVCLEVYSSEAEFGEDGTSFTGILFSGCSAGVFPAAVAFTVTPELPDALREQFPDGTALQFVYDEATNEVVVFSGEATDEAVVSTDEAD